MNKSGNDIDVGSKAEQMFLDLDKKFSDGNLSLKEYEVMYYHAQGLSSEKISIATHYSAKVILKLRSRALLEMGWI